MSIILNFRTRDGVNHEIRDVVFVDETLTLTYMLENGKNYVVEGASYVSQVPQLEDDNPPPSDKDIPYRLLYRMNIRKGPGLDYEVKVTYSAGTVLNLIKGSEETHTTSSGTEYTWMQIGNSEVKGYWVAIRNETSGEDFAVPVDPPDETPDPDFSLFREGNKHGHKYVYVEFPGRGYEAFGAASNRGYCGGINNPELRAGAEVGDPHEFYKHNFDKYKETDVHTFRYYAWANNLSLQDNIHRNLVILSELQNKQMMANITLDDSISSGFHLPGNENWRAKTGHGFTHIVGDWYKQANTSVHATNFLQPNLELLKAIHDAGLDEAVGMIQIMNEPQLHASGVWTDIWKWHNRVAGEFLDRYPDLLINFAPEAFRNVAPNVGDDVLIDYIGYMDNIHVITHNLHPIYLLGPNSTPHQWAEAVTMDYWIGEDRFVHLQKLTAIAGKACGVGELTWPNVPNQSQVVSAFFGRMFRLGLQFITPWNTNFHPGWDMGIGSNCSHGLCTWDYTQGEAGNKNYGPDYGHMYATAYDNFYKPMSLNDQ